MADNQHSELARLESQFKKINGQKIIVVGDVGLDEDVNGSVKRISPESPICTICLVFTIALLFTFLLLLNPKKSTQKEVVNAVKAESVVAKVAAVNPSINTTAGITPKYFRAMVG